MDPKGGIIQSQVDSMNETSEGEFSTLLIDGVH